MNARIAALAAVFISALTVPVTAIAQDDRISLALEEGKSGAVWDVALSNDGHTVYSCGRDSTAKAWSLQTGECLRTLRAARPTLNTCLALSPDNAHVAVGDMNGRLTIWNTSTWTAETDVPAGGMYISDVAYAPDGRSVVTAGRNDSIAVWNASTGARLRAFPASSVWVTAIAVSPDGSTLATAGQDGSVRLWNLATGQALVTLGRHSRFARALCFTPDGTMLLSGGRDGIVKVWDVKRRIMTHQFAVGIGFPHHLALDHPGTRLAVSMMNGLIEIWDWQKSSRERAIGGSYGAMAAAIGSGDRLCTAHTDGAVKVWNLRDGMELASMVGFSDGQWLTFTPDGYYDCSVFGDRYVQWRKGEDLFPLERYAALYKQPSIIEDALAGAYAPKGQLRTVVDPPRAALLSPRADQLFVFGSEQPEVVADVRATDAKRIENILILVNGRQVADDQLREAVTVFRDDTSMVKRFRIPVLPGVNVIEAVAVNAARVRSVAARAVIRVETQDRTLPNLFVLSVGVDQYAPQYPDLTFASLDAKQLAEQLARQEGREYTRVYERTLLNRDATRQNVLAALQGFPQMTPNDVLIMFVSGHGVRARDAKGATGYYFVTSGVQKKSVAKQALSWEDIAKELMRLRAGRVILLLDACHSGAVSAGASNEKVAATLANRVGIIFSSSSGNEYSFEDRSWGHGAFTKALLDGLAGAADFTKNGVIDWSELQLYVTTAVKNLTHDSQTPMIPRLEAFANFDLARVR